MQSIKYLIYDQFFSGVFRVFNKLTNLNHISAEILIFTQREFRSCGLMEGFEGNIKMNEGYYVHFIYSSVFSFSNRPSFEYNGNICYVNDKDMNITQFGISALYSYGYYIVSREILDFDTLASLVNKK